MTKYIHSRVLPGDEDVTTFPYSERSAELAKVHIFNSAVA